MTESDRMTDAAVRPLGRRTPSMDREEARWQAPTVDSDRLNDLELPSPQPQTFQPVMLGDDEVTADNPAARHEPEEPSGVDRVEDDWTLPDRSTLDPTNAAHRVAFRLVGVAGPARSMVANLGVDAASTHVGSRSRADVDAVGGAVAGALSWHGSGEVGRRRMEDPHFEHRVRLTRELMRWPEPNRTVLALRFLAEWTVEQIADVTGSGEGAVRDVTRWWDASEGGNDGGLLHALDQWTEQPDDPSDGAFAPPGPLAHLDDLYESAPSA